MNFKKAFTLSEVLITLVVIGVIAAVTVPTITAGHKKTETISKLKKALSVVNQVLQRSTMDNGYVDAWDTPKEVGLTKYMERYWHPYFSNIKICNSYTDCYYESNKPFKNPNGSASTATFVIANKRVPFLTDDNILYSIEPSEGYFYMIVDINGANKPNKVGRDVFLFEFDTEGKSIRPYGHSASYEELNTNCKKGQNGFYCSAKIAADSWEIKDDYPW